jgi:hypothetical protein
MGQISSHPSDNKQEMIQPTKETEEAIIIKDTYSSYKGLKTDTSEQTRDQRSEGSTNTREIEQKLPIHFEWKDGGNQVYLTGSFSNWTQWFVMNKMDNIHELNLV